MFNQNTFEIIASVAKARNINPAALAAVVDVESGGITFANVDGRNVPVIRIEGHYFDRLVPADKQSQARAEGLASPKAGVIKNPFRQDNRYRMFQRMCDIDKNAAIMSCSWGVGQVMGVHWSKLGFASAENFRMFVMAGLKNQIEVMVRFIEHAGLLDELQRQDWSGFARIYNGPGYKSNAYHLKMAKAYAAYGGAPATSPATGMLRSGSSGAAVRELQSLLQRAGYSILLDGDFGPATKAAVQQFQRDNKLTVDGVVGPKTQQALKIYQLTQSEHPGAQNPSSIPAVKNAVKGGGLLAIVLSIRDQIAETATYLTGIGHQFTDNISSGLMAVAGGVGIGMSIYAAYGWWKSRQTVEQG